MTTSNPRHFSVRSGGDRPAFHVLEVALLLIRSLRGARTKIRRQHPRLASQLEDAAASIAANVAEGNRRRGKDRLHLFRIAAGSADEVQAHLRVAEAFGHVEATDIEASLELCDRELAMLYRLTH